MCDDRLLNCENSNTINDLEDTHLLSMIHCERHPATKSSLNGIFDPLSVFLESACVIFHINSTHHHISFLIMFCLTFLFKKS